MWINFNVIFFSIWVNSIQAMNNELNFSNIFFHIVVCNEWNELIPVLLLDTLFYSKINTYVVTKFITYNYKWLLLKNMVTFKESGYIQRKWY